ncbi:MAG: exosortase N [Flavobacterium sp.]
MLQFSDTNKITVAVLAILILLAFNYNVIAFGLSNDFIGVVFSIGLFLFGARKTTYRLNYLLIGIIVLFEFVSFRLHIKSLHFLSLTLLICLVFYSFTQRFSFIAFICIILFSTLFDKFFNHLTTEIKQQLCHTAFITLKNFLHIEKIEGVSIYINHAKVTIDTACMGLAMFKTGLLVAAVLLTAEEKKQRKYYGIWQIMLFCLVAILLNILSNYFRIITLILFNCTQENLLHHSIGLFCFIFYQILPMLFIIRYFKCRNEEPKTATASVKYGPMVLAFIILSVTSFEIKKERKPDLLSGLDPKYKIGLGKWAAADVFKIDVNDTLVYIKDPMHKPLICWTGAGYKITDSKEVLIGHQKIWYNKMEKNGIEYDSYWWYESDGKKYTSYIEVLLQKLLYGKSIRLINETTVSATACPSNP